MFAVPAGYDDLLERPLYGHLASIRPDGSVQVSPMWFDWDGELLRFAHTTKRQKYRNVQINPQVAMSVSDDPYRYLELRGEVVRVEPDPTATFFRRIAKRYSGNTPPPDAPPAGEAPHDAPDWVVIVVRPTGFSKH
jgi:PPOX class probable F420-dependent enzyme